MNIRTITQLLGAVLLLAVTSCASSHRTTKSNRGPSTGTVQMTVLPERNGGAPDALELTIANATGELIQYGAGYSIERSVNGRWEEVDLGNFAVIAIMHMLQPGDSAKYMINLFADRVNYPEGDYRVVKRINVGERAAQPYYANFRIIEPR